MRKSRYQVRAMSLIEVLVVLAMISFLYIAGAGSYNSFRRYNLAVESLRLVKLMLRNAKYQTHTVRQQPGEYVFGVGVRIRQLPDQRWEFRSIKLAEAVTYEVGYKEYPLGILPISYVIESPLEEVEAYVVPAELGVLLYINSTLATCPEFYIVYEVPTARVHFYCRQGSSLNPYNIVIENVDITFNTLGSKRLRITNLSDIYIR